MNQPPRRPPYVIAAVVVAIAAIALLVAVVVLHEAAQVAFGGPAVAAEYFFGSESMVAHGGWPYRSSTAYVAAGFIEGLVLAGLTLLALWSLWRARPAVTMGATIAMLLMLMWTFVPHFVGR